MPDIDVNEIYGKELDKLPVWAKVEWKDNMLVAPPFFVKLTDECAYLITTTCQISNNDPQATRYVVTFMHRTGLLQEFQYVTPEDDDDEPTGLAVMYLGVEDDGIDQHANQLTMITSPSIETEAGGFYRERSERENICILGEKSHSAFGFEFLLWMKRLHSHTQLVRLQWVN
ncbi:hypothetical protein ACN42_g2508 [Penicillium freii]|uniref:Uncharacterized protein n=1 Tax=Penicillium freii TaxID=48697 RepID=A0A117NQT5_PENFR|nr:hypothetical protein ACN42_g2508 [Penicillium freii]